MSALPPGVTLTLCPHDRNNQMDPSNCTTWTTSVYSSTTQPTQPTPERTPVFIGCERGTVSSVQITPQGYRVGCALNNGESTGTTTFMPNSSTPYTSLAFIPK